MAPTSANIAGFKKKLGERIRTRRTSIALSQVELSERCGIACSYLSRIENGLGNPSLTVLVALAMTLKLLPVELLEARPDSRLLGDK